MVPKGAAALTKNENSLERILNGDYPVKPSGEFTVVRKVPTGGHSLGSSADVRIEDSEMPGKLFLSTQKKRKVHTRIQSDDLATITEMRPHRFNTTKHADM